MPVPGRKCRACERRPSTLPPGRGARARLARALRGERALALPETAHLPHAAPDVDREDVRVLVEAGRPGPAPATLGEPAGPLAAQHRDDKKVRELPHQLVDVGKALAGAEPELGRLPVVLAAAAVVRHRSRGSFRPEAWEARRSRGAGGRDGSDIGQGSERVKDYFLADVLASATPLPEGEVETARRRRPGERLCCWSSVLPWSVVADDGVEDGEEFSGCCDEGDHLGLSGGDEAVAEGLEGWVVTG